MTCVYKEYEVKIKVVQEQWLQLKMKVILGCNMRWDKNVVGKSTDGFSLLREIVMKNISS